MQLNGNRNPMQIDHQRLPFNNKIQNAFIKNEKYDIINDKVELEFYIAKIQKREYIKQSISK